jgi:GMP synthase-like glutamine amidotransferase
MRLHIIQHVPFETAGLIIPWANKRGYVISTTHIYQPQHSLPLTGEYDLLVIMGGSMSVHDEAIYQWLTEEKRHICEAIASGKRVFGICLGAQLIAESLGGEIIPNPEKEIGWLPIAITDEATSHPVLANLNQAMSVFHWHAERFTIPDGALRLFSSEACANQAFLYQQHVLALQFHLEMDKDAVSTIIHHCSNEITPARFIQSAETMLAQSEKQQTYRTLCTLLDNWLALPS